MPKELHATATCFDRGVKAVRRVVLALAAAAAVAGIVRLRGSGGTPPSRGGWRELSGTDLR